MNDMPGGTVTFLFTDIEGSTRLWQDHPEQMQQALARHDALLRAVIVDNGGVVVKTTGDGAHAVFATAPDALAATLDAQRRLGAEAWPPETPILVRMGLHSGTAERRDGDYFGSATNRAARLMAAAHGGQIIVSAATEQLAQDHLPPGVYLRDLGLIRLRGLERAERVFQVVHPDLPDDFPPLRSLDEQPSNLPPPLTSFVGRERELAEITALLSQSRLLALAGAGGSGKTRLSLRLGADLRAGDGDGVWLVELAPVSDPARVPQAVAQALGIKEQAGRPLMTTLAEYLLEKRMWIILDNCEHVVDACARLADTLLRACPLIRFLTSSREPLGISGEVVYRVPCLSLPHSAHAQTSQSLSQYEAVRLFIDRAKAIQPNFTVTDANAPALAQICIRLDGIPLALELAAARIRSLPPEQIMDRLDDRFRLLTGGSRTALPRQQTLRALIDWSHDLLSDSEKAVLRRLAVFAGGWTLEAAESICAQGDVEDWEVLDLLTALADKSLVLCDSQSDAARYRMLESIRQYAGERLRESGEEDKARDRHRDWFSALAQEAKPQLLGPEQSIWLARLEAERDNLYAALSACLEDADPEPGLRLAAALGQFWLVRGHLSEGRRHLDNALSHDADAAPTAARANALQAAGNLALRQADYDAARALYEGSLAIEKGRGNESAVANGLGNLGLIAWYQADYAAARALQEQCLEFARRSGDQRMIAKALGNLGLVADDQGEHAEAQTLHEGSLAIQRALGDQRGMANSLNNLGMVAIRRGEHDRGRDLYEQSLAIKQQLGDQLGIASSFSNLAGLAYEQGDYARARSLYAQGLIIVRDLKDRLGATRMLEGLAALNADEGKPLPAVRLFGAADTLRRAIHCPWTPREQQEIEARIAAARVHLGDAAFAAAWDTGKNMTWDQAADYALADNESSWPGD